MSKPFHNPQRELEHKRIVEENERKKCPSDFQKAFTRVKVHSEKTPNIKRKSVENGLVKFARNFQPSSVTDWCLAASTLLLLIVAYFQFEITRDQLNVSRNDERAWVKVSKIADQDGKSPVIAGPSDPLIVPVRVENIGKTVAKNIQVYAYSQILDYSEAPTLGWVENNPKHPSSGDFTGMFFPSDSHIMQVRRVGKERENLLVSQEESSGLDQTTKYVAVFGIAYYDDIFQIRHWTKFCIPFTYGGHPYNTGDCISFNSEGALK